VGWLRALAAAAITPMLGWLTIILLLSVLEPWLVTLARQREAAQLDPQTATSAAAVVFVFGVGQVGLLIAASTVAFGLRFGGSPAAARSGPAVAQPPAPVAPASEASRAQRLAFDLQRDEARAETRWRPAQLAAALSAPAPAAHRPPISERSARLGDAYRRPTVAARRQGART
jgi:type IV secretion system protein VirB6